jgi:hypothetical protein
MPTVRPLRARYSVTPPNVAFVWLEADKFLPPEGETVLLAWPRGNGFTFRTGRFNGGKWRLSCDTEPHREPVLSLFG